MSDEYKAYERRLWRDKIIHHVVKLFTIALIIFSIWFVYASTQKPKRAMPPPPEAAKTDAPAGQAKPLPDFIIDKVPSDELEQLKP